MKLTPTQIRMLERLAGPGHHAWAFPKDGRKAHGESQTLASLYDPGVEVLDAYHTPPPKEED